MKIYRVLSDVTNYQTIMPVNEDIWATEQLLFDCKNKINDWQPPPLFVFNPKKERGNFFYLGSGVLVFDKTAYETLGEYLEMSGEILELTLDFEPLFALNVLECVNMLDANLSVWNTDSAGNRFEVKDYVFYRDRIIESSLFKIPETSRGDILTYTGVKDAEDEFFHQYNNSGLTGLEFAEIYTL